MLAIIGAIVGEYLGGNSGLGYLLISKMNAFETDGLFAVMIHMTMLGFIFYFAVGLLRGCSSPGTNPRKFAERGQVAGLALEAWDTAQAGAPLARAGAGPLRRPSQVLLRGLGG